MKQVKSIVNFGSSFINGIVPSLLEQAFQKYKYNKKTNLESCTIIILICISIEAARGRFKYFNPTKDEKMLIQVLGDARNIPPNLEMSIVELFCLRDAIVHNHIHSLYENEESELFQGYGDKKLKDNSGNNITNKFKLHVRPDRIDFVDAIKALLIFELYIDLVHSLAEENYCPWNKTSYEFYGFTSAKTYDFYRMLLYYIGNLNSSDEQSMKDVMSPVFDAYHEFLNILVKTNNTLFRLFEKKES